MTAHEYLQQLLESQELWPQELATLRSTRDAVESGLRRSHGNLPRFYYAGSYGKDTLIRAAYDLDIVMYFPSTEDRTLSDLFWSVHRTLVGSGRSETPNCACRASSFLLRAYWFASSAIWTPMLSVLGLS